MQQPDVVDPFRDLTLEAFTTRLASAAPVPGGGSASAVAAALGASLVTMVASLSTGRPKFADHEPLLDWAIASGEALRSRFLELADQDAEAYAGFSAALKLPKGSEAEIEARRTALRGAARRAADIPLACVEACLDLVGIAEALAGRSNANASSDLNVAALLGAAAARGAAANVIVNLPSIGDPEYEGELLTRVNGLLHDIDDLATSTHEVVGRGEPREPVPPATPA